MGCFYNLPAMTGGAIWTALLSKTGSAKITPPSDLPVYVSRELTLLLWSVSTKSHLRDSREMEG